MRAMTEQSSSSNKSGSKSDTSLSADKPGVDGSGSSKSKVIVAVVVAAVILVVGGAAFFLLRNDAPDRVSLEDAAKGAQVDGTQSTDAGSSAGTGATDGATGGTQTGIEGEWVVDTETGDFDWESATGTFAGFRVNEELANVGATTAVGRTGSVSGSLSITGSEVTKAEFTVDLPSIRTNNNMRDSRVRKALETDTFPEAKLKISEPIKLPSDAASGAKVSVTVPAELTVKGKTNKVSLAVEAKMVNDTIVIVGSTPITFSDFGVEVPGSPIVLSVEDHGEMEFQALMKRP